MIAAALCVLWALFAAGATWYCLSVLRQVAYITLADGRRQERRLPLLFRLLLPLSIHVSSLFQRPSFAATLQLTETRLIAAGFQGLLSAGEFWSLRLLLPLIPGVLLSVLIWMLVALVPGHTGEVLSRQSGPSILLILLLFFAWPGLWLRGVLHRRQHSIQRALPFVLDLLTLSVEAGLDFMTAMQRITARRQVDELGEEMLQVIREIQLGKTRRLALGDMAKRVDQADVRTVVSALIQADELGVGIAQILRIQSDQMRQRRFERAEKLANEAPVKLLLPLVVFIFPAVFLVLLGPIVLQMLSHL
ncbi:MAG: type II secretion system F family protein [bacterium]